MFGTIEKGKYVIGYDMANKRKDGAYCIVFENKNGKLSLLETRKFNPFLRRKEVRTVIKNYFEELEER